MVLAKRAQAARSARICGKITSREREKIEAALA
jgi:hypothetical protein